MSQGPTPSHGIHSRQSKMAASIWRLTQFFADYPTAAKRPMNSCLFCDRLTTIFNVRLPPLDSSLERCLKRLLGAQH